jgi:hypothetical protein
MGLYDSKDSKKSDFLDNLIRFTEKFNGFESIKKDLFAKKILPYTLFAVFQFTLLLSSIAISISNGSFLYQNSSHFLGILFQVVFIVLLFTAIVEKSVFFINAVGAFAYFAALLSIISYSFFFVIDNHPVIYSILNVFDLSYSTVFISLGSHSEFDFIGNPIFVLVVCFFLKLDFQPFLLRKITILLSSFTLLLFALLNYFESSLISESNDSVKATQKVTSNDATYSEIPKSSGHVECKGSYEEEKCEASYAQLESETAEQKRNRRERVDADTNAAKAQISQNTETAQSSVDINLLNKCQEVGASVVNIANGAEKISNIQPLVTWRASCAEKPPVGDGNVVAICDGDLVSKNGASRRIFYWQKLKNNGELAIGYHLCVH